MSAPEDEIEFEAFDGPAMPETIAFEPNPIADNGAIDRVEFSKVSNPFSFDEVEALTPAEVARIEAAISQSNTPLAPARKKKRNVPRVFLGEPGDPRNGNY